MKVMCMRGRCVVVYQRVERERRGENGSEKGNFNGRKGGGIKEGKKKEMNKIQRRNNNYKTINKLEKEKGKGDTMAL